MAASLARRVGGIFLVFTFFSLGIPRSSAHEPEPAPSNRWQPGSLIRNFFHKKKPVEASACPTPVPIGPIQPIEPIIPLPKLDPKKEEKTPEPKIDPLPMPEAPAPFPETAFDAPTSGAGFGQLASVKGNSGVQMFGDKFGSSGGVFFRLPFVKDVPNPNYPKDSNQTIPGAENAGQLQAINPSGGNLAGRTTVYENNGPLPQDRLIFNYDYFQNTSLSPTGIPVNRYLFGFEKTFLDGQASIEVRMPFASTLSDNLQASDNSFELVNSPFGLNNPTQTILGNLHVQLKGLLYSTETFSIAGGLGISIPTAPGTTVDFIEQNTGAFNGRLRMRNGSVLLEPYLAAIFTPGDRMFFQTWVNFSIDAGGSDASFESPDNPTINYGRLQDQTWMGIQTQLGYWIIQNNETASLLRGLAPFAELHYHTTLNDADVITENRNGQLVPILGNLNNRTDELNLSVGCMTDIGENLRVSVGAVVPLRGGDDQFFDYQVGVRVNYFFGYTARQRSMQN